MGRLHTHNHGKSHSTRPIDLQKPSWVTQSPKEIEELIIKYGKEELSSSLIGMKLRDQHAIPLVKPILKKGITEVLEENDLKQEYPEDLNNILNKAIGLQKHLKSNKSDNRNGGENISIRCTILVSPKSRVIYSSFMESLKGDSQPVLVFPSTAFSFE